MKVVDECVLNSTKRLNDAHRKGKLFKKPFGTQNRQSTYE